MAVLDWISDAHLDHADAGAREAFLERVREGGGSAVVVTGDTATAATLASELQAIAEVRAGAPLYHVLGNHDHYGGSIAAVRDAVIALEERVPRIRWLPPAGVALLDAETALIGVDGWADGGFGDPLGTPLRLNDDRLIAEIAAQRSPAAQLAVKRALANADADRLAVLLERAAAQASRIVVATHVPPFVEVLPQSGHLSHPHWLPLVICRATGDVLRRAAAQHSDREFLILAGHTHVAADVRITANLRCLVARAEYGAPALQRIAF